MEAVIWVEGYSKLGIYIAGAVAAAVVLVSAIDGGLGAANALANQYQKYSVFDFSLISQRLIHIWSGLLGGCFLTMSTHRNGRNTMVTALSSDTDRPRRAIIALLTSGGIVLAHAHQLSIHWCFAFRFLPSIFTDPGYATALRQPHFRFPVVIVCFLISLHSTCQPVYPDSW